MCIFLRFLRFVGHSLEQIYIRCYRCSIVQLYDIQKSLKMVVTLYGILMRLATRVM